jgi:two-component system LytT family sensor kinase
MLLMKQVYSKYKVVFIHAFCWTIYIGYEQLAVFIVSSIYQLSAGAIYFYILNICLFYLQTIILELTINKDKPAYLKAAAMMGLMLLAFTFLKIAGEFFMSKEKGDYLGHMTVFNTIIILNLIRSVFYMIAGTSYWLTVYNFRLRAAANDEKIRQLTLANVNADLQVKLSNTQNAYLQQQISPHLLFNTLNFVYSTVHKHAPNGGRAIFLLTEILDFSLGNNDETGRTELSAEIDQINNLIDLNRYRFDFDLPIELVIKGAPAGRRIIPLVLLTLVENMFVHGDLKDKAAGITLAISASGLLEFTTANAISRRSHPPGRGTGLNNIRTRLEHAYPESFQLGTEETDEHFFTKLTMQL